MFRIETKSYHAFRIQVEKSDFFFPFLINKVNMALSEIFLSVFYARQSDFMTRRVIFLNPHQVELSRGTRKCFSCMCYEAINALQFRLFIFSKEQKDIYAGKKKMDHENN